METAKSIKVYRGYDMRWRFCRWKEECMCTKLHNVKKKIGGKGIKKLTDESIN